MEDSLYFSEQHLQVRDMVRDFAQQVVKPSARRYDLESRFPWDNVKQMAELGLFGIPWPEELGGSGMDYLSYITVIHELAKVDASHAITVSAHTTLGTSPIVDFGTPDQKRRYVPLLAQGRLRRRRHQDGRGGQGRPLRRQRLQDLHYPRRGGRDLRRDRPHGSQSP